MVGGRNVYGLSQESHGMYVCVLPATNPQLMAATCIFLASGRIVSNVLPLPRAMYSVHISGRCSACSSSTRAWNPSGHS